MHARALIGLCVFAPGARADQRLLARVYCSKRLRRESFAGTPDTIGGGTDALSRTSAEGRETPVRCPANTLRCPLDGRPARAPVPTPARARPRPRSQEGQHSDTRRTPRRPAPRTGRGIVRAAQVSTSRPRGARGKRATTPEGGTVGELGMHVKINA